MKFAILGCLVFAAVMMNQSGSAVQAEPAVKSTDRAPENLRRTLELFRSDLNATKIRTLNQVMKMTAAEAEKFWPIYQKYETELAQVGDRRVVVIREFVNLSNQGKLSSDNATDLSNRWLADEEARLELWKKYNTEIGKAVSPMRAAQFLQVEHQIALLVDIAIASEMPTVGQPQ